MNGRILIDTDAGVDDLLALYVLSRVVPTSALDVAVTYGNVPIDQALHNVSILFGVTGVRPRALFRGRAAPLHCAPHFAFEVHGDDGIGGSSRVVPWSDQPNLTSADLFDERRMTDYDKVIAIGPLSDIAMLTRGGDRQPPLFVMGGAFDVPGNISGFAEFNFFSDPDAARMVFESYPGDIFVVPLDVCRKFVLTRKRLNELCERNPSRATRFLRVIHQHYMNYYQRVEGIDGCYPHDTICAFAALFNDVFVWERGRLQIVKNGRERGRSIFHRDPGANRFIAKGIAIPRFVSLLENAMASRKFEHAGAS